ncbi:AbrB/MazE/SpoVT family DNA-binding domain-containing protein [Bacillus salitolerans]|uniref:AbrB/MazE/SpoVT family DNA-binding domain-containing protein n=1 Tax=Bacillus salitolerans TaxID=1437434 RepID=A0ABW4LSY3_9BACI
MAKVSSKGQIWLPVDVKEFLKINEGDLIHFRVDEGNRVVWLHKDFH